VGCLHALLAEHLGARKIIFVERLEHRIREIERHTNAIAVEAPGPARDLLLDETGAAGADVIITATSEVRVDGSLLRILATGGVVQGCGYHRWRPAHKPTFRSKESKRLQFCLISILIN